MKKMKQIYLKPNIETSVFVESKMMQMLSPSQDNPAPAPTNPQTPFPGLAPKVV